MTDDEGPLAAGSFSSWLAGMDAALDGLAESDVPCGTCTACCTASQFVHIGPEETDALAHIPAALVFPAPRLPAGHVLMGYDERGHCPMVADGGCSIYDHRPEACRVYDCRVFPAAGIDADADKPAIVRQARRWRFDHPTGLDTAEHDAVRRAAAVLVGSGETAATTTATTNVSATEVAVLAIRRRDVRPATPRG